MHSSDLSGLHDGNSVFFIFPFDLFDSVIFAAT